MPPVLDSSAYPHIIDRIVTVAPYASLLRLRAVSRALWQRSDALLVADRIIVTASTTKPLSHISALHDADINPVVRPGRVPALANMGKTPMVISSAYGRLPAFASWALDDPRHWKDLASVLNLQYTRTIDLVGPALSAPVVSLLESDRLPPITIRVLPDEALYDIYSTPPGQEKVSLKVPAAHTLVRFASLPQLFEDRSFPSRDLANLLGRRVIHNITLHPDDDTWVNSRRACLNVPYPKPTWVGTEVVYIFHPADEATEWPSRTNPLPRTATVHDVFDLFIKITAAVANNLFMGMCLTIVGIESLELPLLVEEWSFFEDQQTNPADEVTTPKRVQFLKQVEKSARAETIVIPGIGGWSSAPDDSNDDAVLAALKKIRFLSIEEYRAEIGEERAAVEMRAGEWCSSSSCACRP